VRKALTSLPWVRQVQVDFARQQAVVTVLAEKYDRAALLKVLARQGYDGKVLKEEDRK
jgi:hypothetical protein